MTSDDTEALKITALEPVVVEFPKANSTEEVDEDRLQSTRNMPCDKIAVGSTACMTLTAAWYGKYENVVPLSRTTCWLETPSKF